MKLNSFSLVTTRKDKDVRQEYKTERKMETEYDDRVEEQHKLMMERIVYYLKMN